MSVGGVTLHVIGGPTVLLRYGGLSFLTDPTFSEPGEHRSASGFLTKLTGPSVAPREIGEIDVVLLSHDHHADNLDPAGRDFLETAGRVLTTAAGTERLRVPATALAPYETVALPRPDGGSLDVVAVPAEHGPPGIAARIGPVIGFVLRASDLQTVYVSGDNASLEVVREIAGRFPDIDVAVVFAGGAQVPEAFGDAYLTLSADGVVEAARILESATIVPIHQEGWAHFSQDSGHVRRAFAEAGLTARLRIVEPGSSVEL